MSDIRFNPYLNFGGDCEAAFQFYAAALGGSIEAIHTYAGSPMAGQIPPGWENKVMHASLIFHGQRLMGSDGQPGQAVPAKSGFALSLNVASADEAETLFTALSAGGTVTMPIQPTFWAERFGMLIDRFGIPWMVNCEKKA